MHNRHTHQTHTPDREHYSVVEMYNIELVKYIECNRLDIQVSELEDTVGL